jgi:hypothetical protein
VNQVNIHALWHPLGEISPMDTRTELRRLTVLGVLAIASGLVGCSVLQEKATPKLTAEVAPGVAPAGAPAAKFYVEIRPEKGKPQAVERPLTDQMHIQTALEQTGVHKKFARMQLELYRPLPSGGWHKMQIEFDEDAHRVPPEFDYALLPGDRIVATQDTSTVLDDILEKTLEPLGVTPHTKKAKQKQLARKYPVQG